MLTLLYITIVIGILIGIFIVVSQSWLLDGFSVENCVEGICEFIQDIFA